MESEIVKLLNDVLSKNDIDLILSEESISVNSNNTTLFEFTDMLSK